jgi:hypothetical protein
VLRIFLGYQFHFRVIHLHIFDLLEIYFVNGEKTQSAKNISGLMTDVKMKSDVLVESKHRSDARQASQRRRMSKHPQNTAESGEYDPDLALAIQESLKLARQQEATARKQAQLENASKESLKENKPHVTAKAVDEQLDGFASTKRNDSTQEPGKQLKDLLLLHIDLVQQQQELLTQKDREIKTLANDKVAVSRLRREVNLVYITIFTLNIGPDQ